MIPFTESDKEPVLAEEEDWASGYHHTKAKKSILKSKKSTKSKKLVQSARILTSNLPCYNMFSFFQSSITSTIQIVD